VSKRLWPVNVLIRGEAVGNPTKCVQIVSHKCGFQTPLSKDSVKNIALRIMHRARHILYGSSSHS
jgi:hypothetical protein